MGGIVQFAPVSAINNTTAETPIYFFPNEGDNPFAEPADPTNEYPENGTTLSDEISKNNPTYLIVKGRAAGYNVDGYYKIAILYKPVILGEDGESTGETELDFTYDIIRNNHYKVNLNRVDNPGYATFDETVAAPANNIAYDITIGSGNSSDEDTFTDSRAETIISHNGFFYVEVVGSEIYAQGYGAEGVEGNFGLSLTRNNDINSGYNVPTLYIQASEGITINNNAIISDDDFAGTIGFTAKQSGTITLRCGDMLKEIPVYYSETPHVYQSGATIGGASLSAVSSFAADDNNTANDIAMIALDGSIEENTTYKNREFRGKAYPADMSKGIRKVYVKQASNFDLWDNVTGSMAAEIQNIVYQSTGNIYTYNGVDVSSQANNDKRDYSLKGEFDAVYSSNSLNSYFNPEGWATNNFSFYAVDIGTNMTNNVYVEANSHIESSANITLTNIAGETKKYTFNVEQFAYPYEVDTGQLFSGYCYGNIGETIGYCYAYNVAYTPQPYDATSGIGWRWIDESDYATSRINAEANEKYISVKYLGDDSDNKSTFRVHRNTERSWTANEDWRYAIFEINCKNGANEPIVIRINTRVNND